MLFRLLTTLRSSFKRFQLCTGCHPCFQLPVQLKTGHQIVATSVAITTYMTGKLLFLAEAIRSHLTRCSRCHHKNGKLFFLPRRSMLLLTAGVAVTTKTGNFSSCRGFPYLVVSATSRQEQFLPPDYPYQFTDTKSLLPGLVTATNYCHCKPPGASARKKSSRWFAVAVK